MDTDAVENAIRPLPLTRKNALFAGNDDGAVTWARMASLIGTCKLNGINPQSNGRSANVYTRPPPVSPTSGTGAYPLGPGTGPHLDRWHSVQSERHTLPPGQIAAQQMLMETIIVEALRMKATEEANIMTLLTQGMDAFEANKNMTKHETFGAIGILTSFLDAIKRAKDAKLVD